MLRKELTTLLLSVFSAVAVCNTNMMVFSDPHVFAPSLFDTTSASFKSYYQSEPKLVEYSAELFDSAVARVIDAHPDILLIPGDLTKDGERASHDYVIAALTQIENAGTKVYVIPGNHDISNPASKAYLGICSNSVNNITSSEFSSLYDNFGHNEAILTYGLNYLAYPNEDIAIIGINSCKQNDNTRYSAGGIDDSTLLWVEQAAHLATASGRIVLAMMHHEIMSHFDNQAEIATNYLANQEEGYPSLSSVQERLTAAGIHVVFTGHYHIQSIQSVDTEEGILFDISTGSTCSFPSPIRSMTFYDNGILSIDSHEIVKYHALEQERNQNTARGGIAALAKKFYPYVESMEMMMASMGYGNKYRFPGSTNALAADLNTYMLPTFTLVINELSRGDEETRISSDSTLYNACIAGMDNYLNYFCYNSPNRRSLLESFFFEDTDMPGFVRQIVSSILFNYVTTMDEYEEASEHLVSDGRAMIVLRESTPTCVGQTKEIRGVAGVYSISGQLITPDSSILPTLPNGMYIVDGKKHIVR